MSEEAFPARIPAVPRGRGGAGPAQLACAGRHRRATAPPAGAPTSASMLGVSRGTLRAARAAPASRTRRDRAPPGQRHVRRPHRRRPGALQEGLERLESYASLARRRGCASACTTCASRPRARRPPRRSPRHRAGRDGGADRPRRPAGGCADGAHGRHRSTRRSQLPSADRLRTEIEREGAWCSTSSPSSACPSRSPTRASARRSSAPATPPRAALGVTEPTAVLALDEIHRVTSGQVTHHSRDIFAPEGIDLRVVRWVEAQRPTRSACRRGRPRRLRGAAGRGAHGAR